MQFSLPFVIVLGLMSALQRVKAESTAQPQSSFFEKHAEGWHWYNNILNEEMWQENRKPSSSSSKDPTKMIEEQRKELEQKLHAAIVDPSRDNIITYILAQRALMDQSGRFADSWKQVVMTNPSLDETLVHPVDQKARHVYYEGQRHDLEKRIKGLSHEYGLFFFFRKNCAYCHHFAPVVKRFAEKYGWSVLGISLDGGTLPEFPHAKKDNGVANRLQINNVPALIALHPKTGRVIPLAYGMVSESEIESRAELLTSLKTGETK